MTRLQQQVLFPEIDCSDCESDASTSTFLNNMKLPVHRWFRYSAGFSGGWVRQTIRSFKQEGPIRVLDPFAGSGTTLIAAEIEGVEAFGMDSHPFVARIARAKLAWRSDPSRFLAKLEELRRVARSLEPRCEGYPPLIYKCYDPETLAQLDTFRQAYGHVRDNTPASDLVWLALISILRRTSTAGTAQWQYVLPKKAKRSPQHPLVALDECARMMHSDMLTGQSVQGPHSHFVQADARQRGVAPNGFANLVITSPPYPNNYDYADATRLEMSFMREITGWGDLQANVRCHLIRSCSQHVPERSVALDEVLASRELEPIREPLQDVCQRLAQIRKERGGKKTYHLMVACYFRDLALVWKSLRDACQENSKICFIIGDSAPYGIYVPVVPWMGSLARAAGFRSFSFERTRDRNIKWKNRKHRVPLQEGRLWVEG